MESLSNKKPIKEGGISLKGDLEGLKEAHLEVYESLQKEFQEANKVWEKARMALLGIKSKEIEMLRSMKNPPYDILGVNFAVMFLLAGNVSEDEIQVDEKSGGPLYLSWKGCQKMLKKFDSVSEEMLRIEELIDEGKFLYGKMEAVREYLDMQWFHVPSLKLKSIPTSQLAEFLIHVVEYFDMVQEIRFKIKTAFEKSDLEEERLVNEGGFQERED